MTESLKAAAREASRKYTDEQRAGELAQRRAAYWELVRRRAEQLEHAPSVGELAERMRKCGLPEAALKAALEPKGTRAHDAAREFLRGGATFLLLLGPPGIGKTTAAAVVAADCCSKFAWGRQPTGAPLEPAAYVEGHRLTRVSAFDKFDSDWLSLLKRLPLVVLDDAGDEATEVGKGLVVELLMDRYSRRRRTVVCANLTHAAFRDRYGPGIWDRMRESAVAPDLSREKSLRQRWRDVQGATP